MSERSPYRERIAKIPEDASRPLWSVMIPTYNCAAYLRETLTSVLAQDPGPRIMQIEVIDDRSTRDDPAAVVEELGKGRVTFYQQPRNVGHIKNFQTCLERSRGRLIHLLHGDDRVRDGFYRKMQRAFEERPDIGAAFCRHIIMDERGHWLYPSWLEQRTSGILSDWLERIAIEQRIQTPAIVVKREVYENLGAFDRRLSSVEDWEMWVRIAANYPVWYEVEPLALYRARNDSNTEHHLRDGREIQNMSKVIDMIQAYLPPSEARELYQKAKKNCAFYAIEIADKILSKGDIQSSIFYLKQAIVLDRSPRTVKALMPLVRKLIKQKVIDAYNTTRFNSEQI